jgi:hypothetical protein
VLQAALAAAVLGFLPVVLLAGALLHAGSFAGSLFDFGIFEHASQRVIVGESPYPDPDALPGEGGYLYPPLLAWVVAPLAALTTGVAAQVIFTLLTMAAVSAALLLLGVRDWRCHGAAFIGGPMIYSFYLGTAVPLLLLGIAVAWRLRERRPVTAGVVIGLVVALKPFLWPLLFFPLLRRQLVVGLVAAAAGALAVLVSWAAIDFAGFGVYPDLLRAVTEQRAPESYSLTAVLHALGLPLTAASVLALAAGLGVLVYAFRRVTTGEPRGDALALGLCLTVALVASPIVWSHYLVLLLVPIALAAPRFGAIWLAPVALHLVPDPSWSGGELSTIAPLFLAAGLMLVWAILPRSRSPMPA